MRPALALALLVSACGPAWQVVRQATPNPFSPQTRFTVEAVRFDNLMLGELSEGEWSQGKSAETLANHRAEKAEFALRFNDALTEAARGLPLTKSGAYHVRPILVWYIPGHYASLTEQSPAKTRLRLQILDARAQVIEEIEILSLGFAQEPMTDLIRRSPTERLHAAAVHAGETAARYLRERAGVRQ